MPVESERLRRLARQAERRDHRAGLDGTQINGSMAHRLPHNLNISFAGRRRRRAADGNQRRGRFERLGVHVGDDRAELRAERAGRSRRSLAQLDSLWPRAGSTPRKKWITPRPACVETVKRLRELSPLYEAAEAAHQPLARLKFFVGARYIVPGKLPWRGAAHPSLTLALSHLPCLA